jgi:hypothetical protein
VAASTAPSDNLLGSTRTEPYLESCQNSQQFWLNFCCMYHATPALSRPRIFVMRKSRQVAGIFQTQHCHRKPLDPAAACISVANDHDMCSTRLLHSECNCAPYSTYTDALFGSNRGNRSHTSRVFRRQNTKKPRDAASTADPRCRELPAYCVHASKFRRPSDKHCNIFLCRSCFRIRSYTRLMLQ